MKTETRELGISLKIEQMQHSIDNATKALNEFKQMAETSDELREWATNEVTKYALSIKTSKLDTDELENFFKYPYVIIPGKSEQEHYLAIPKFIDAQFGWLHKVTPSFNIFLVNRYVDWLGELPAALKKELKMPDPLDIYLDGDHLVGSDVKKAKEKYGQFIRRSEKDGRLLVDKSRHFELLASLIKDGILPFVPKPVAKEDLIERPQELKLRDYQQEAWNAFLKYSNIGAFFPPSTGKTWLGLWAMTHIKPPHLIVVPTRILIEQWKERIELYTDLQPDEYDVLTYQSGIKSDKKYKLMIVDEVHHMPSNEFSKLATVNREYSIGLSATPQREDNREEFIFALTGKPVGLSWDSFKKLGIITNPSLHIWIVKNDNDRIKRLDSLLQEDKKTVIFCDFIEMGKTYAKRFDVPFVYGDSKNRLEQMKDSRTVIVSRIADEGVSLPDIERVIEIAWLKGSRRQELQRFTRLLHGRGTTGEGHIIMTAEEYQRDHKRLFGIMDKGFKLVLHRDGVSEKVIQDTRQQAPQAPAKKSQKLRVTQTAPSAKFETQHQILQLPGVQKLLPKLRTVEVKAVDAFYRMPEQVFSSLRIVRLLGYANVKDSHIRLSHLISLGFIKQVGKEYQASPETLAG